MKTVLITGGSSSLGQAVARKLSDNGFFVFIGVRDLKRITPSKDIRTVRLDITDDKQVSSALKIIKKTSKDLYALVNLAGVTSSKNFNEFSREEFRQMLDVNVVSPMCLSNACLPLLNSGSRIINVTSLNGIVPLPRFSTYSASKHALEALGMAMRTELSERKVWVTNIAPGAIKSDKRKHTTEVVKHTTARQKYPVLKYILPMCTEESVADTISQVLESNHPKARIVIGTDAIITSFLYRVLPSQVWEKLVKKVLY